MSKIVNLRQARKAKARAGKKAEAEANAARFGQTKAERQAREAEAASATRRLDGHQIEKDEP